MTTQTIICSRDFSNAMELASALTELCEIAKTEDGHAVVYTDSDGFGACGDCVLVERALTDGSKVYDIRIRDNA